MGSISAIYFKSKPPGKIDSIAKTPGTHNRDAPRGEMFSETNIWFYFLACRAPSQITL